ncbi:MAG TPA: LpqN/LpqT family lipoprotein [Mycobacterium sp.]|nr:LpqN/LpqT family lipoprotein [Mycobacterium sp.]HQC75236.1 LpqN/LpqT family lipoprotein [Mycobacterium sp.]
MRNVLVAATAGLTAAALSFGVVGCASGTKTESKSSASESTSASASASGSSSALQAPPTKEGGLKQTLHDYILEHDIAETPYKPGDPGTPTYDFTIPEGWGEIDQVPDWAYGGIVYEKATDPADPPTITAVADRLTGDVEAAEVLQFAPGLLDDLEGFVPAGEPVVSTFSGFESIEYSGTYVNEGKKRFIDEKTVVVPAKDGSFFVLQLNGDALDTEQAVVQDAMKAINQNTKITAP